MTFVGVADAIALRTCEQTKRMPEKRAGDEVGVLASYP